MEPKDIISIVAVLLSPIIAILISQFNEKKRDDKSSKLNLFMQLMMFRQGLPISEELVKALNLIDVIFHHHPSVTNHWHDYLDMVSMKDRNFEIERKKYLDLLFEIAKSIGYINLKQTDIDRCYFPVGLGNQKDLTDALQKEQLQYLQNSNRLLSQQKMIS